MFLLQGPPNVPQLHQEVTAEYISWSEHVSTEGAQLENVTAKRSAVHAPQGNSHNYHVNDHEASLSLKQIKEINCFPSLPCTEQLYNEYGQWLRSLPHSLKYY